MFDVSKSRQTSLHILPHRGRTRDGGTHLHFFAPSERQKKLLEGHRNAPREMQQITKDAIRSALATGGTIDIVHTHSQIERASLGIGIETGPARIHINVNIEC